MLGQHKVLSFPRYAQVPHDRRDICCGSITWETSSLLQLLTPTASHIASPAVPGQLLILPTCPRKSFKMGKKWQQNHTCIPCIALFCPVVPQLTHPPLASFSRFPNQYCKCASHCGADPGLPGAGLDAPSIF